MNKKPSRTRKGLKVIFIVFIILLAAMIILPFVFKGKIMEAAKTEINNNLDAKVDFEDFGLSLFTNFPNFSLHLDEVSVVGIEEFEGDTLADISSVYVVINILSVINTDAYEVKKIRIVEPNIHMRVLRNEMVNWDIAPGSDEKTTPAELDAEASAFSLTLKKVEIIDANISYEDIPGNMKVLVEGMNHSLSGNFSADKTTMKTKTNIAGLTYELDGLSYLNNVLLAFDATIDADLKNEIYTFKKNELSINELLLQFDGSIAIVGGNPNIVLTFNAPKNSFKSFLSLIPAIYQKNFQDIQTSGDLTLGGYVKGTFTETDLPSFKLDILAENAAFQYPGLPASVSDINMAVNVENSGGDVDNTIIDIKKLNFSIMDSPVEAKMLLSSIISDPYIDASLNGHIDLAGLANVYPLEAEESLEGLIDANIALKGRLSSIENQAYKEFDAIGSFLMKDVRYSMEGFDNKLEITHAQMNFSPAYIDLVNLDFRYAESDMVLKGMISNYLGYALSDKDLYGTFNASSKFFNVNQFISESREDGETGSSSSSDTVALTAFMVPANIDFDLAAEFDKILYDNIELEDVKGSIVVKDEKVSLRNLHGNLFSGSVSINGSYDTKDTEKPIVDFSLNMKEINFVEASKTFGILQKFAPIFEHALGSFSTNMSFNTLLKDDMSPDWVTFIGEGLMNTTAIKLENVNTLNKLSDALKLESFKSMDIDPLKVLFEFDEGKLIIKPFDMIMQGMKANLSGWTALDQSIGYNLEMGIPKSILGGEANNVMNGLIGQANAQGIDVGTGETIDLAVLIGGTLLDPTVKPAIGSLGKNVIEDISNNAQKEIEKQKEELEQNAKQEVQKILNEAEQQAQKIIAEARKQSDQVKSIALEASQKMKTEADAHANQLVEEGKKNGMLAEAAAKTAAEEYKKKAYTEADNVVAEANNKADGIMNTAQQQASKIRSDAQKKVEDL